MNTQFSQNNPASGESGQTQPYHNLISEILTELKQVLDEHVVTKAVADLPGLKLSQNGDILTIDGDPQEVIQKLVDRFLGLSNILVAKTLQPLLKQCPWIKLPNFEARDGRIDK